MAEFDPKKKLERIVVHNGVFHGDDVMCVAIAQRLNPDVEVIRTNQPEDINTNDKNTIVCDVGLGKYDHHQKDAERRPDGKKRAACGLFLQDVWEQIFPDKLAYEQFEKIYVIPFEDADNGTKGNTLFTAVAYCRPAWDSENYEKEMDVKFFQAVHMIKFDLDRFIDKAEERIRSEQYALDCYNKSVDKNIVYLPKFCQWETVLCPTSAKFVIMPSDRGGYSLQNVPVSFDRRKTKKVEMPKEWLDETKRPDGCTFVHHALFCASFETVEQAQNGAKLAIQLQQKQKEEEKINKPEVFDTIERIVVHGGTFHGDDVLCVALAKMLNPDVEVVRTNHPEEINTSDKKTVICDIGCGVYDHHQSNVKVRKNGHKYSACGLLYEDYGKKIMPNPQSYKKFLYDFIIPTENSDNTGAKSQLYSIVENCRPNWDDPNYDKAMNEGFNKAVDLVYNVTSDFVRTEQSLMRAKEEADKAIQKSGIYCVVFDKYGPWDDVLIGTKAKFAVYPYPRGGFTLRAIAKNFNDNNPKIPLPDEWTNNKPNGCTWVNESHTMASFKTVKDAQRAVNKLLGIDDRLISKSDMMNRQQRDIGINDKVVSANIE